MCIPDFHSGPTERLSEFTKDLVIAEISLTRGRIASASPTINKNQDVITLCNLITNYA